MVSEELTKRASIITFYSYKGGTGRTMALANTACLMARRMQSVKELKPILIIDWDIEAPGLHRYFDKGQNDNIETTDSLGETPGLLEFFEMLNSKESEVPSQDATYEEACKYIDELSLAPYISETFVPKLKLLKAGHFDSTYPGRVIEFNWRAFHKKMPWFFRAFAARLEKDYHTVLIDSRTGLTDVSGICTMLMPDKLVVVFTPNQQSLTNVKDFVTDVVNYRKQSDDLRTLMVFPLPSRIDESESDLEHVWRHGNGNIFNKDNPAAIGYQRLFQDTFEKAYNLEACDLQEYFNKVRIQHSSKYAYGEGLPVEDSNETDRLTLKESYEIFYDYIITVASPWLNIEKVRIENKISALLDRGRECIEESRFDDAFINLMEAVKLFESNEQMEEFGLSEALHELAKNFSSIGNNNKSIECLEKSINITEKVYDKNSPKLIAKFLDLSELFYSDRNLDKSLEAAIHSLDIMEATLGNDHPKLVIPLRKISELYTERKDFNAASMFEARAGQIGKQKPMESKKIRAVFLSSTARDLSAYREKVAEVINRQDGFKCVRMEEFGARDAQADEFCRTKIKQCDIAVFIVGLCHGSSPDQTEDSYTAREYQEAVSVGVSRLAFLTEEDVFYPGYYRESDEQWQRQQAFRKRLNQELIRDTFATPEELASKVSTALGNWAMQQTKPLPVIGATLAGSGALAQGNHAVAASHGGIAVGGDLHGDIIIGTHDPTTDLDEKLARYYRHMAIECRRLPLEVIDSKFMDGQEVRLPDIYVPLHALRRTIKQKQPQTSQEEEKRLAVLDAFAKERRAVLLGEPGSGKTVLVNYLAGCLAEAAAGGKLDDDIPDTIKPLLPIRLILREVAAAYFPHSVKAGDTLLWQAVRDDLSKRLGNSQIDEVFFRLQTRIRQTGALFFLDGLDEVPESGDRRKALLESVRQLVDNWKNCRFLVTARPYAYAQPVNRLTGFPVLELVPFDEDQRNAFIAGWYRAMQSYIGMSATNADYKAQSLQTAAQRPELVELASRPLLLTLMATLHTSRGTLPKDRAKLYDDSVELLLGSWQRRRLERGPKGQIVAEEAMMQVLDSDLGGIRKLMEQLAFTVHERQRTEGGKNVADITEGEVLTAFRPLLDDEQSPFKSKALLDYLDTQAGLLIARAERGPYAFPHRSFQEYLAASHLCRRSGFPKRFRELTEQDALWWREVFLLGVGAAGEGNLADMINALVPRDADKVVNPGDPHWRMAVLAGLALVEQNVKDKLALDEALQAVYERVQAWLVRFICEGHLQAVERAEAGTVLGQLGDPRFDPAHWHLPAEPLLGFRPVPAGVFTMGSDLQQDGMARKSESPQQKLELPAFYMARWPVTVAQFAAFVQSSSYAPQNRSLQGHPNHPVVYVSWQGAIAYCQWLNERLKAIAPQRLTQLKSGEPDQNEAGFWQGLAMGTLHVTLPSEAEWEVAARGADGRRYPWGNEPNPQKANYDDTGINETSAVGCFPAGVSPFGVEDLSGNVWEWTRSVWGDYPYPIPGEERQQRENLDAKGSRVLRGGAFYNSQHYVRCASRNYYDPDNRNSYYGFRVVVSPFL